MAGIVSGQQQRLKMLRPDAYHAGGAESGRVPRGRGSAKCEVKPLSWSGPLLVMRPTKKRSSLRRAFSAALLRVGEASMAHSQGNAGSGEGGESGGGGGGGGSSPGLSLK